MPEVKRDIVIAASPDKIFDVVTDYCSYPEFLPEMQTAEIVSQHDGVSVVRFELELIMRVSYTLRLVEDRPNRITWTLEHAKMMTLNSGYWQLAPLDDATTRATYALEIKLRGLLPKSVSTRLLGTTLPQTLGRFKERIESR